MKARVPHLRALRRRLRILLAEPDRGSQTVDVILWIAVVIVVVGGVGALFRDAVTNFFNSLVITVGL